MYFRIKSFLSNAGYVFVALTLQRVAAVGLIFFAIRRLSIDDFGTFTYLYATATSLSGFLGDVFSSTVLKYVPQFTETAGARPARDEISDLFWVALISAITISGIVYLATEVIMGSGGFHHSIPAAVIALLVVLNATFFSMFSRRNALKLGACASTLGSICILSVSYFSQNELTSSYFLWIPVAGLSLSTFCYISFIWIFGVVNIRAFTMTFPTIRTERLRFMWTTALALSLGGPIHWLCLSVLHGTTDGVFQMAVFSAWFQWYLVITFIPSVLVYFTIPWLSKAYKINASNAIYRLFSLLGAFVAFGFILFIIIYKNSDGILSLYKIDYRNNHSEFLLSIACAVIVGSVMITSHYYLASGRVATNLIITLLYSISYLLLTLLLVQRMDLGAFGLFLAILIAASLQLIIQLAFNLRQTFLRKNDDLSF